jgi:amidohydrolase
MNLSEKIKTAASRIFPKLIEIRQWLHQHPELSFEEKETSAYIQGQLRSYGIPFTTGWAGHGIVGEIIGEKEGDRVVALRADMDALPIFEANEVHYKSKNAGVMHACGHDVHSAGLLGAAAILSELKSEFGGTVKLIFQPGEEKLPGGASIMIKEGVLENPKPDAMFAMHVHPPLEVGKVGMKPGLYMASADEIYIDVIGQGGHAALPDKCVDPIIIASEIIIAAQSIVSRKREPSIPAVLSFGKINTVGGATNIIPNRVKLEGTFRAMDETFRDFAHQSLEQLVKGIAASHGGEAKIEILRGYPCLVNDDLLTAKAKQVSTDMLGTENVIDLPPRMSAEDFAYYSHHVPTCFIRLGTGNVSKGITSPVHTDTFDIDENALAVSSELLARLALAEL